jgi:transposase
MKIENIDIQATIEKAQSLVRDDQQLSAATRSMFEILILIITLLANRLNLNSTNRWGLNRARCSISIS